MFRNKPVCLSHPNIISLFVYKELNRVSLSINVILFFFYAKFMVTGCGNFCRTNLFDTIMDHKSAKEIVLKILVPKATLEIALN